MKNSLILLMILLLVSCKKEQPQMTPLNQECDCAKEVSAEFVIEEMSSYPGSSWNKLTITDSIFKNKNVQFRALFEDASEYKWYIGQEVLTGQKVGRYFNETLAGTSIPITLVVKKKPNYICLPNDDGYDSITKFMYVSNFIIETETDFEFGSIESRYRVKSDHLPDSFDIKVYVSKDVTLSRSLNIENYDGMGSNIIDYPRIDAWNYKQIFILDMHEGYIYNHLNGIFELNIRFFSEVNINHIKLHYFGRRL